MSNIILTVLVLITLMQTALVAVFLCKSAAIFREFVGFITPPSENEASPAASVWQAMVKALTLELKTTLMGMLSVQAKAEKRLEGELVTQAVAARSPIMAAVLEAVPGLKKLKNRNPELIEAIAMRVASLGKPAGVSPNGGHDDDFASRLARYG